jgi:hypothetical protein
LLAVCKAEDAHNVLKLQTAETIGFVFELLINVEQEPPIAAW